MASGSSVSLPVDQMEKLLTSKQTSNSSTSPAPSPKPPLPRNTAIAFAPDIDPPRKSDATSKSLAYSRSRAATFAKSKSRFFELNHPADDPIRSSPLQPTSSPGAATPRSSAMPKTPLAAEEEEDEIYRKAQEASQKKKRVKIRLILEWVSFVLLMALLVCCLTVKELIGFTIWGLEIWRWCLMILVIFSGRLVSSWIIGLIVFLVERNFLLRSKVLYFVYGVRKSVQICLWVAFVLLTWSLLFDNSIKRDDKNHVILSYITKGLGAILIGTALWLVKTLLVKILASTFHVNAFFDRIQESIFNQYVLETLSGPPVMEMAEKIGASSPAGQLNVQTEKDKKKGKDLDVIDVGKLQKLKGEKVSAWTMKRLVNVIRSVGLSTLTDTIDESDNREWEGKQGQINSEWEAKAAAYRIFRNVAKTDAKYIEEEDLLRFLSREEVDKILPQFGGATETGKVKKSALRNWVVKIYLERKSLAHSLDDTKTAVRQLHKLASFVILIIIVIVCLLFMGFATTQVLFFISSQLLLVVFIFGNTCKTLFESIIFVFVMHPFDVGDRCVIDGVQMIVEEMNILTTIFLKYDNEKIFYPNSVLLTKPISNFYRSPDMSESVEFCVDVCTPVEIIGTLKARIQMYLESKPQHWHPKQSVVVKEIQDLHTMRMALYTLHTMNHQNMPEKNARRTELLFEMKKIFEDLNIKYHLLPLEVNLATTTTSSIPTRLHFD